MSRQLSTSPKLEFETKRYTKLFLVLLEWSIFSGLIIGVGFFVQEVWNDYQTQVTTVKQYSEKWRKSFHQL